LLIQNDNKQVVIFGNSIRQIVDKWGEMTDYTERESFTYSLMQDCANQDYAMAEITVGKNRAEFQWTFAEERDRLVEHCPEISRGRRAVYGIVS